MGDEQLHNKPINMRALARELRGVESAHYFDTFLCGGCPNIHFILRDELGDPIAQFTASRKTIENVLLLYAKGGNA